MIEIFKFQVGDMRTFALLALLMMAGCSQPQAQEPIDPPPPERRTEEWEDTTWKPVCLVPNVPVCPAETHEFSEWHLDGIGHDLWINLTWKANDDANVELTVVGAGQDVTGPSPLTVHVEEPDDDLTITVHGRTTPIGPGAYRDAPPQPFHAIAEFKV